MGVSFRSGWSVDFGGLRVALELVCAEAVAERRAAAAGTRSRSFMIRWCGSVYRSRRVRKRGGKSSKDEGAGRTTGALASEAAGSFLFDMVRPAKHGIRRAERSATRSNVKVVSGVRVQEAGAVGAAWRAWEGVA